MTQLMGVHRHACRMACYGVQGKVTKAVDVYSFAMIMIELFTGERLFKGMEAHQLMFLVRVTALCSFSMLYHHYLLAGSSRGGKAAQLPYLFFAQCFASWPASWTTYHTVVKASQPYSNTGNLDLYLDPNL